MTDPAREFRRALVARLRERGGLADPRVEAALLAVPRERYLAAAGHRPPLEEVYADEAIVTRTDAHGRPLSSSSQPGLMARMLEQLDVRAGQRVLEIGTGTGYNAALLAALVGPSGRVRSVEVAPAIAATAARALRTEGVPATVREGDGRHGDPTGAPYDRIIVTASTGTIPAAWRDQLVDGGRLQLPLRLDRDGAAIQVIPVLERRGQALRSVALTWGGFMPLHGGEGGYADAPPSLRADLADATRQTSLLTLVGGGLAAVSEAFARRLLADLLGDAAEVVREGVTAMSGRRTPRMVIHLLLAIAPERRVSLGAGARMGVGLLDVEHGGLGLLALPTPWRDAEDARGAETVPVPWRLLRIGDGRAAEELERLIDAWERRAATRPPELVVTAGGSGDPLDVAFSWR